MPIYEYVCESCHRASEALQRLDEPPLTDCPHCGGPLRKVVSAPAFQFKGSGWYVTDYARKSGGSGGRRSSTGDESSPASGTTDAVAQDAGSKDTTGKEGTAVAKDTKPQPDK